MSDKVIKRTSLTSKALEEAINAINVNRDLEAKEDFFREFFPNIPEDKVKDFEILMSIEWHGILSSYSWVHIDGNAPRGTALAIDTSVIRGIPTFTPRLEEEEGVFINPCMELPTIRIPEA